jgi:hypothetical protein
MNASINCRRLHFGHCFSLRFMSPRIAEARSKFASDTAWCWGKKWGKVPHGFQPIST